MDPDTPILMVTLQIPITPEITEEEVLHAIEEQVREAFAEMRRKQALGETPEGIPQAEFNTSVLHETEEAFSGRTIPDLLARLGYMTAL